MPYVGGCLCGAVRIAISGEITKVVNCHCQFCRRAHGAAFITEAIVPAEAFEIVAGEDEVRRYEQRYFCGTCASRLFNRAESDPSIVAVMLSALDEPPAVRPAVHLNVESKAAWVEIKDEAKQYTGFRTRPSASQP